MALAQSGWVFGRLTARGSLGASLGLISLGASLGLICLALCAAAPAGAASGDYIKSFGPDGTTGTDFDRPSKVAVDQESGAIYISDRERQVLYKFDADGIPLNFGGSAAYISGNEITGLAINPTLPSESQIAVDSDTHVIYVTSDNKVRAFEENGEPHNFTAGPGEGSSEIPGATKLVGVAVDSAGNIYTSDFEDQIVRIYSRSGALITEFEPVGSLLSTLVPANLAVSPSGTLYVIDRGNPIYAFTPTQFPPTPETTYGLGQPLDQDLAYSEAVDPATEFVYVSQEHPPGEAAPRVGVYDDERAFIGSIGGPGQPGQIIGTPGGVGVNGESQRVYVAVDNESGSGPSQVAIYEGFAIPVGPPFVTAMSVTDMTSTAALLQAKVNPNTLETAYWFEYGLNDCAEEPNECIKVPSDGASVGSGHKPVSISASLTQLAPDTQYFYRVVVENSDSVGPEATPTRSFKTQTGRFGSSLSDGRAWEQVTPANKYGGVITNAGLLQADPDGSGITFQTRGSIVEDPVGNRALEPSAALGRRTEAGWNVEDLVPTHTEAGGLGFGPEFKLFSPNLKQALFEPRDDTALSPESSERTPYLRTNSIPPSYRPLVTSKEGFANVPPGTAFGGEVNGDRNPVAVTGANSSLTFVALSSKAPLAPGAEERSLYLWNSGQLEAVSELPEGEGGGIVRAQLGSGTISVRHAVSEDGSRVFWAPGDPTSASLQWPALYLRDTAADQSSRIDVPEEGVAGPGVAHPAFMAASADGSVVFFTDSRQLTSDASPDGRDLYRCEIGDVGGSLGCVDIDDLSAPLPGSEEDGNARELALGMSETGSTLYFVAKAILDPEPNAAGENAVGGSPNLYVWQEGQGVRLVAPLSEGDGPDWGLLPTNIEGHGARVAASSSPSGRYLAFMSERNLTGAESDDPETGEPVEQAFLYDALEDETICISCNPSGATDAGHLIVKNVSEGGVILPDPQGLWAGQWVGATLPEPSEGEPTSGFALYWPRAVLDNGRAYFNSTAPLVTGDSNGTWDVYQYEPDGIGTCDESAASGTVALTESGCLGLISSGTDDKPSVYMDASETGEDVFFATFARLSVLDKDDIVDVYDARVNGVAATVEESTECAGEACQPSAPPPPASVPNSATFNGDGNLKQKPRKHCKKGQRKVKRHGKVKCVKAKKHNNKKKQKQKSARAERGA